MLGDAAWGALLDEQGAASSAARPSIHATACAPVADVADAQALGVRVATMLLDAGGRDYLPAT